MKEDKLDRLIDWAGDNPLKTTAIASGIGFMTSYGMSQIIYWGNEVVRTVSSGDVPKNEYAIGMGIIGAFVLGLPALVASGAMYASRAFYEEQRE